MRAVLDTDVLVAAFLTEGVCAKLLVRARKRDYEPVLSVDILWEVEKTLRKIFSLLTAEMSEVRALLTEAASQTCTETDQIPPTCRDPDDDKILACAQTAHADFIVTGDVDLLVLRRFGAVRIVSPRDFESLFAD